MLCEGSWFVGSPESQSMNRYEPASFENWLMVPGVRVDVEGN